MLNNASKKTTSKYRSDNQLHLEVLSLQKVSGELVMT